MGEIMTNILLEKRFHRDTARHQDSHRAFHRRAFLPTEHAGRSGDRSRSPDRSVI
jgi:hypothetical protein